MRRAETLELVVAQALPHRLRRLKTPERPAPDRLVGLGNGPFRTLHQDGETPHQPPPLTARPYFCAKPARTSSLDANTTVAQDAAGPDSRGPWAISE